MHELARAAILYASHGRKIFPLASGSKVPAIKGDRGVLEATNDEERVRSWWSAFPSSNIGLAVLPHEIVIDVDGRNGGHESLSAWTDAHGALPHTPCQVTPTNGVHYLFKRPAGFDLVGKPAPGIDVLGVGKYIVGAPSRLPQVALRRDMSIAMREGRDKDFWRFVYTSQAIESNGGRDAYAWAQRLSKTTLAELPDWLAALVLRPPAPAPKPPPEFARASADVLTRAERYLEKCDPAIQGSGGSSTTFRVAVKLARGFALDEDTALDLLERIYNPRCDPPWTRRELRHKVKQAISVGDYEWGALRDRPLDRRAP